MEKLDQRIRQLLESKNSMAADVIVQQLKSEGYDTDPAKVKEKIYNMRNEMNPKKSGSKKHNAVRIPRNKPVAQSQEVKNTFVPHINEAKQVENALDILLVVGEIVTKAGGIGQFKKIINSFNVIGPKDLGIIVNLYQNHLGKFNQVIDALEKLTPNDDK